MANTPDIFDNSFDLARKRHDEILNEIDECQSVPELLELFALHRPHLRPLFHDRQEAFLAICLAAPVEVVSYLIEAGVEPSRIDAMHGDVGCLSQAINNPDIGVFKALLAARSALSRRSPRNSNSTVLDELMEKRRIDLLDIALGDNEIPIRWIETICNLRDDILIDWMFEREPDVLKRPCMIQLSLDSKSVASIFQKDKLAKALPEHIEPPKPSSRRF